MWQSGVAVPIDPPVALFYKMFAPVFKKTSSVSMAIKIKMDLWFLCRLKPGENDFTSNIL